MISCVLCMEDFVERELVKIFCCGHQFHYQCYLNNNDKLKCPVCRKIILSQADMLWFKSVSLFNDPTSSEFETIAINNLVFKKDIIKKKILALRKKSELDKFRYQQIICKFVDEHIGYFRVKILEHLNENKYIVNLYSCPFGQLLDGEPFIFLTSGPRSNPNYFLENNMKSIIDLIQERIGYLFTVKVEKIRGSIVIIASLVCNTLV